MNIQDAMEQVAQLKSANTHIQRECIKRGQRIAELERLLSRAADVLEKYTTYPIGMVMSATLRETGRNLITELRKAAE